MTVTASKVTAVLVSVPGAMHDALQTTLKSLPTIELLGSASGALSAYDLLQEHEADILVIDANLPEEETLLLLGRVRHMYPEMRCLVLTTIARQGAKFLQAGADVVIPRNSSFKEFETAVFGTGNNLNHEENKESPES